VQVPCAPHQFAEVGDAFITGSHAACL
jgi:hypothetical protein